MTGTDTRPPGHRTRSLLHGFARALPLTAVSVAALVSTSACSQIESTIAGARAPKAPTLEEDLARLAQTPPPRPVATAPAPRIVYIDRSETDRVVSPAAEPSPAAREAEEVELSADPRPRVTNEPSGAGEYVKDQATETARRVRDDVVDEMTYHAREAARAKLHQTMRRIGL